jgi:hypothetical protein
LLNSYLLLSNKFNGVINSFAVLHNFDEAPAPGKNLHAARVPAPLYETVLQEKMC